MAPSSSRREMPMSTATVDDANGNAPTNVRSSWPDTHLEPEDVAGAGRYL